LHAPLILAKTNNFLLPNGTFIFEWIVFVLVLIFLWRKVIPRISAMIEKRQETIRQQFEEAQQAKERLTQAEQEYREALRTARAEAQKARDDARAEGQQIVADMRQHAQAEAQRIQEANEKALAAERGRVLAELRNEVGRMATELASRIVGEALRDEDLQRRVIDRFVEEIGEEQRAETEAAVSGSGEAR
jgi:F-type H+-transporting ATPase subunit b